MNSGGKRVAGSTVILETRVVLELNVLTASNVVVK